MNVADWFFACVAFVFGACWGSFMNVCIYRIPAEISVISPGSSCPECKTDLTWRDNIPIFGWIFLRGKCRYCSTSISPRYPSIELLTAILFTWIWLVYPGYEVGGSLDFRFLAYWLLTFGLVFGSFVDIDEMWIPDRVTIGGMIAGPIVSFILPAMHRGAEGHMLAPVVRWLSSLFNIAPDGHVMGFVQSMIGLGFGFGILWLVSVLGRLMLKKDAMGFGDVKLMGALGAFLGFDSILFIVFVSSLLGTIVGVGLIAIGKREWQTKLPFGPYIALAAIIWALGGSDWWDAYIYWATGGV